MLVECQKLTSLAHLDRDKMDPNLQTFPRAFSYMATIVFWLTFNWNCAPVKGLINNMPIGPDNGSAAN